MTFAASRLRLLSFFLSFPKLSSRLTELIPVRPSGVSLSAWLLVQLGELVCQLDRLKGTQRRGEETCCCAERTEHQERERERERERDYNNNNNNNNKPSNLEPALGNGRKAEKGREQSPLAALAWLRRRTCRFLAAQSD